MTDRQPIVTADPEQTIGAWLADIKARAVKEWDDNSDEGQTPPDPADMRDMHDEPIDWLLLVLGCNGSVRKASWLVLNAMADLTHDSVPYVGRWSMGEARFGIMPQSMTATKQDDGDNVLIHIRGAAYLAPEVVSARPEVTL